MEPCVNLTFTFKSREKKKADTDKRLMGSWMTNYYIFIASNEVLCCQVVLFIYGCQESEGRQLILLPICGFTSSNHSTFWVYWLHETLDWLACFYGVEQQKRLESHFFKKKKNGKCNVKEIFCLILAVRACSTLLFSPREKITSVIIFVLSR